MNKNRKTSHILNVFQYDVDGHVILPASLTLTVAPASNDNSGKVGTTAWVRSYVTGLNYLTAGSTSTSDISEGTNLYYTTSRFDTRLATKSTTDLAEGTGLYFTTARARNSISVIGSGSYDSATGIITITGGVTAVNTKTGDVTLTTSDITEGTRLYYTDTRVGTYLTNNNYATQSYVTTQIANLVDAAPGTLDTLNELAAALGDDPNFATSVATSIGTKQAQLNGTGFVKISGTTISYDNSTYLTSFTEIDPIYVASSWYSTTNNASNWNTAYGWGNHASAGYLTTSTAASTYVSLTGAYANPAFVASLAYSKITGVPSFLTSYTETDTLASVTGRGATTTSAITINKTGTLISHAGMTDAIGYNASYGTYIGSLLGGATYYIYANGQMNNNGTIVTLLHTGNYSSTLDSRYLYATSNPSTAGNFTLSIGNNGSYSYVQSHSGQPLELNPVGNTVRISGNVAIHAGNYSSYAVPTSRTITINGTALDLTADRSFTVSASDATKLPLAGGTMTGTISFSNVVGNKIDFYYATAGSGDRYGIQVQDSELRIHSGAAGASTGGITFGKSTGTTFTEHLRIRNDGNVQVVVGTLSMAASGTSYIRMGVFPNSTSNSGEAWIGRASDRNAGTMTVQLGGGSASSRSFEVVDYAWSTVLFSVGSNGNISASGTITGSNLSGTNTGDQNLAPYLLKSGGTMSGTLTLASISGTAQTVSNSYGAYLHLGDWAVGRTAAGAVLVNTAYRADYATDLFDMNISRFTNNSGYLTSVGLGNMTDVHRLFNNMGNGHGTYQDFNSVGNFGVRYMQGSTNGPQSGQFYGFTLGLGNDYSISQYGSQFYWMRNTTNPYIWIRYLEGGSWNGWTKTSAGYADSAGSAPANGGNSSTVGGYSVSTGGDANTIPTRNASGYLIPQNWIQFNGNYGLYFPNHYGLHFYPNNDGSYGAAQILGDKGGWKGLHFGGGTGMTLMMNETEFGFHRQANGWYARFTNGRFYGACDNVYNLDYALGNTHYWTAINYFQTNNGGQSVNNSNSAKLQAYSTGNNSAFMSFHKGSHYAINMGLDDDNVFRIGGWSASGNRLQMDMSGNLTMAGDVTAYSDARVKENIVTVDNALNKVLALRGVYYNRIDSDDKKTKLGVIAQEILQTVPEVVNQDNDGMFNVSYGNLAGLFIEAFKEQQKQIEELKSIIYGLTR